MTVHTAQSRTHPSGVNCRLTCTDVCTWRVLDYEAVFFAVVLRVYAFPGVFALLRVCAGVFEALLHASRGVFETTHIVELGRIEPHKEAAEDGGKYEKMYDISHAVTRHLGTVLLCMQMWSEGLRHKYRYITYAQGNLPPSPLATKIVVRTGTPFAYRQRDVHATHGTGVGGSIKQVVLPTLYDTLLATPENQKHT